MKKWTGYQSPLAESIERFLQHKRALCKKYRSEEPAFRALDRYLLQIDVRNIEEIDSTILDQFFRSSASMHAITFNARLGIIRRLFEWMVNQGTIPVSPLRTRNKRVNRRLLPFIFKHDDIRRLLIAASDLRDTSNAHRRAETWQMMILLGYGLGMRIGEICNLRVGDIDFDRNVLLIANSKFGKSRYLPMGPKLARRLSAYVTGSKPRDKSDRVFRWRDDRVAMDGCNTWRTFRQLMLSLDLRAGPGHREPRFHDLRHSFAVNTLLRFYQEGKNPAQHLLSLSTFLGHSELHHTAVYLTITDALLHEANGRFQRFAMQAIEEVPL
jgi:integrase